jgi:hypothetical protein
MNNVTGIIKLYLQQLPVPLCTYDLYAQFLSVGKSMYFMVIIGNAL